MRKLAIVLVASLALPLSAHAATKTNVTGTLFWQPKPGGGIPTGALIGLVALAVLGLGAVVVVRRRRGALDEPDESRESAHAGTEAW